MYVSPIFLVTCFCIWRKNIDWGWRYCAAIWRGV